MSSYCRSHSPEKPSRRVKAFIYTIRHRGARSRVDKTSWRGELLQAPKLPTRGEHPSSSTRRHLQPTLRQQRGKMKGFNLWGGSDVQKHPQLPPAETRRAVNRKGNESPGVTARGTGALPTPNNITRGTTRERKHRNDNLSALPSAPDLAGRKERRKRRGNPPPRRMSYFPPGSSHEARQHGARSPLRSRVRVTRSRRHL